MSDDDLERRIARRKPRGVRDRLEVLVGGCVLILAVVFFIIFRVAPSSPSDSTPRGNVTCYPITGNGWTFQCEVTGRGEKKHDDLFNSDFINVARRQGQDPTRTYRGFRWKADVRTELDESDAGVKPDADYTFHGTVVEISGPTVWFTDCLFEAKK